MQTILLKALSEGTTDIRELQKLSGAKTAAEVYRTFDKLAIRKEYHAALAKVGITMEFLINGIKNICENGFKDSDKLKAFQILLKSIGLDKYEKDEVQGKDWEDVLLKLSDKEQELPGLMEANKDEYDVVVPPVPEEELNRRAEEKRLAKELYE